MPAAPFRSGTYAASSDGIGQGAAAHSKQARRAGREECQRQENSETRKPAQYDRASATITHRAILA